MSDTPPPPEGLQRWTRALAARSAVVEGVPVAADGWWYLGLRLPEWEKTRIVRIRPEAGLDDVETVVDPADFVRGGTISDWRMVGSKVLAGIADGTEFGPWVIVDPETRRPVGGGRFGECRASGTAYDQPEGDRPGRLYHVAHENRQLRGALRVMLRENPLADTPARDVPVELAPPRWGSDTFIPEMSVQKDGKNRWLVVSETSGTGQQHRAAVYDLTTDPRRPTRVAFVDTTSAGSKSLQIRNGWAYFLTTESGRRPYGALVRAPLHKLGTPRSRQTLATGDAASGIHLRAFAVHDDGRISLTRTRHGRDSLVLHGLRETDRGPRLTRIREFTSPGTPFASIVAASEVTDSRTGSRQLVIAWDDIGGRRLTAYPNAASTAHELRLTKDLRARGPKPVPTVTRDIPFRFGSRPHQTGVVRLTTPVKARTNGRTPTVVMRDAYPLYGEVQFGRTPEQHMVDDAVHAAGGATAVVYHDHPRQGGSGVAELPHLLIGAGEALAERGAAKPGRMFLMGGSGQAVSAAEALRLRSDLFHGAALRSAFLRVDAQGLARGVGFCNAGANSFGPELSAASAYGHMRDHGIVRHPGARRPVLLMSFGMQDTRTYAQDQTFPYARVAARAGADVRLMEFPGGHFMQWAGAHGGAEAFATQIAQVEAVQGGFAGPLPPRHLASAVAVTAGRGMATPLAPPTHPRTSTLPTLATPTGALDNRSPAHTRTKALEHA
ncbi:hypothetical protein GCM10023205_63240 [Yinghuangia aomiensis]|uniref:Peptidase S9 prolyl oligopeptidase catalytic domain-containing protein n=1 Tax=Yinghuangia aomiensis TaxID=676205 RepID=A0ABP9I1X4_9ACTN